MAAGALGSVVYADLHTHILPGVDDGSPDMQTSLRALQQLSESGVRQVAITPHVNLFFDESAAPHLAEIRSQKGWPVGSSDPLRFIPDGFAALEAAAAAAGIDVGLHQGGELSHEVVVGMSAEQLDCVALGPRSNRWVLMEVSIYEPFDASWCVAADYLRERGYDILLAHPERAPNMHSPEARRLLRSELDKGVKLQVNLSSLNSPRVGGLARSLLTEGLAWCVASDFHPPQRPANLANLPELMSQAGLDRSQAALFGSERPWHLLDHGF